MKLFTAILLSMLVVGVAEAREKSNKTIGAIVADKAGNIQQDLGEYPSEVAEFAKANDCLYGGENSRCVYQVPLDGVVKPAFITLGDVGGELVLVATEVPTHMLDAVAASFEVCAERSPTKSDRAVCAGFAWTFNKAGDIVYYSGFYASESVVNLGRAAGGSVEFLTDAGDSLTYGRPDAAAVDVLHGAVAMPLCYALSLIVNGVETVKQITEQPASAHGRLDCSQDVRQNREESRKVPLKK